MKAETLRAMVPIALVSLLFVTSASGVKAQEQSFAPGQHVQYKPNQFQNIWEEGVILQVIPQTSPGLKQVLIRAVKGSPGNPSYHDERAYQVEFVRAMGTDTNALGTSGSGSGIDSSTQNSQPATTGSSNRPVGNTGAARSATHRVATASPPKAGANQSAGGPRLGRYLVYTYGAVPNRIFLGTLDLLPGGIYKASNPGANGYIGQGTYSFSGGNVTWNDGPYKNNGWNGAFTVEREGKTHQIRLKSNTVATNSTDS